MRSQIVQLGQEVLDGLQVRDANTRAVHALLREKMNEISQTTPAIMRIHEILPYVELAGEIQPSTMRTLARRARALYTAVVQDARGWSGGADRELDRETAEARREMATLATRQGSLVSATPVPERRVYDYILQLKELAREVSVRIDVPPRTDPRMQALATMLLSLYQNRDIPSTAFQLFASSVAAHIFLAAERAPTETRAAERAMDLYKAFLRAQGLSASAIDQTIMEDIQRYRRDLDEELARRAPAPAAAMDTDETLYEGDILPQLQEVARQVLSRWTASPRFATAHDILVELAEEDVEDVSGQAYARDVAQMTMVAAHDDPDLLLYRDIAEDMYRAVLRLRRVPDARIEEMVTTERNETYDEYIGAYEEEDEEDNQGTVEFAPGPSPFLTSEQMVHLEDWEQPEPVDEQGNDWYLQHREMYLNRSIGRTDVPTLRATQPVAMRAVPDRTLDSMAPLLGDRPHGISAGQTYFMCTNPVPHYYDAQGYDEYCQGTVTTEVTPGMQGKGCLRCPYCRTLMDTQLYQVPVRRSERLRR